MLYLQEPEDSTIVVDSDDCDDEAIDAQAVMANSHKKVHFPRILLDVVIPSPVGENIIALVLRHACITGYDTLFKHDKKRVYLDSFHSNVFNANGILNQ